MISYTLFIQGKYKKSDLPFYKKLCERKVLVAVDGGYRFFKLSGMVPNILIGDFDSIGRFPVGLEKQTTVITYPTKKDSTDLQLAIEHCCSLGGRIINIVSPEFGEPDHYLGNAMLMIRMKQKYPIIQVRLISRAYEIIPLIDDKALFRDAVGSKLSVLPLSEKITLSLQGVAYGSHDLSVGLGETISLRNEITAKCAKVEVVGKALVVRQFPV